MGLRVVLTLAEFMVHAEALFHHPVTEVVLTDRVCEGGSSGSWGGLTHHWKLAGTPNRNEATDGPGFLPKQLFDLLDVFREDQRRNDKNVGWAVFYPNAEETNAAISRACVAFGRRLQRRQTL